jgi:hypothetical protein
LIHFLFEASHQGSFPGLRMKTSDSRSANGAARIAERP